MDHREQPCDESGAANNTRECVSDFIRERVGCHIPMQNMEPGGKPKCSQIEEFDEILNLTLRLSLTDSDSEIYEITGCLSSCNKVGYSTDTALYRVTILVRENLWLTEIWDDPPSCLGIRQLQ